MSALLKIGVDEKFILSSPPSNSQNHIFCSKKNPSYLKEYKYSIKIEKLLNTLKI